MNYKNLLQFLNLNQEFERAEFRYWAPWYSSTFWSFKTKDGYLSIAIATLDLLAEVLEDAKLLALIIKMMAQKERSVLKFNLLKEMKFLITCRKEYKKIYNTIFTWIFYWKKVLGLHQFIQHKEVLDDPQVKHMKMFTSILT